MKEGQFQVVSEDVTEIFHYFHAAVGITEQEDFEHFQETEQWLLDFKINEKLLTLLFFHLEIF